MKPSTRDEFKGTAKNIVGHIKTETGKVIGNPKLQSKGAAEQIEGKVQKKIGEIEKTFGN